MVVNFILFFDSEDKKLLYCLVRDLCLLPSEIDSRNKRLTNLDYDLRAQMI